MFLPYCYSSFLLRIGHIRETCGDFNDLRQEIVSYVDTNRQSECVVSYHNSFTIEERATLDLDGLIRRHYVPGDYANELFFQATVEKLDILLLITNQHSTNLFPFLKFWPHRYRNDDTVTVSSFSGTKILIGHANLHFQSLKYVHTTTTSNNVFGNVANRDNRESLKIKRMDNILGSLMVDFNASSKKSSINDKTDKLLRSKCGEFGINFIPPAIGESTSEIRKRRKVMKNQIKEKVINLGSKKNEKECQINSNKTRFNKTDNILRSKCEKLGINFIPPTIGESTSEIRKRRKIMKNQIKGKSDKNDFIYSKIEIAY